MLCHCVSLMSLGEARWARPWSQAKGIARVGIGLTRHKHTWERATLAVSPVCIGNSDRRTQGVAAPAQDQRHGGSGGGVVGGGQPPLIQNGEGITTAVRMEVAQTL